MNPWKLFLLRLGSGLLTLLVCLLIASFVLNFVKDKVGFMEEMSIGFGVSAGAIVGAVVVVFYALSALLKFLQTPPASIPSKALEDEEPPQLPQSPQSSHVFGPLVWQQCKLINLLLQEDSGNFKSISFTEEGVLVLSRWLRNSREGLEFRVKITDIVSIDVDEKESLVLINTGEKELIQSLMFTAQDPEWKGDYGYSSGPCKQAGFQLEDQSRLIPVRNAIRKLAKTLTTPARTFAELPDLWIRRSR